MVKTGTGGPANDTKFFIKERTDGGAIRREGEPTSTSALHHK